jgi:hypothetical protein
MNDADRQLPFERARAESGLSGFAKPIGGRLATMGNRLPLIDEEGEVRELTEEDFARARPASKVLPEILGPEVAVEFLKPRPRGPQKKPRRRTFCIANVRFLESFSRFLRNLLFSLRSLRLCGEKARF